MCGNSNNYKNNYIDNKYHLIFLILLLPRIFSSLFSHSYSTFVSSLFFGCKSINISRYTRQWSQVLSRRALVPENWLAGVLASTRSPGPTAGTGDTKARLAEEEAELKAYETMSVDAGLHREEQVTAFKHKYFSILVHSSRHTFNTPPFSSRHEVRGLSGTIHSSPSFGTRITH